MKLFNYLLFVFLGCFPLCVSGQFSLLHNVAGDNHVGMNIIAIDDGGYLASGGAYQGAKKYAAILRFDSLGSELWHIALDDSNSQNTFPGTNRALQKLNDSTYLHVGNVLRNDTFYPFVYTFNDQGQETGFTVYEEFPGVWISTACILENGNIWMAGERTNDTTFNRDLALFIGLDNELSLLWDTTYAFGINNADAQAYALAETGQGDLIATIGVAQNYDSDFVVARFNANGELIWYRNFFQSEWPDPFAHLVLANDNIFVASGIAKAHDGVFGEYKGFISRISMDNELIWSKEYGTPQLGEGFLGIHHNQVEGTLTCVGTTQDKHDIYGPTRGWFLTVNMDGDSLSETRLGIGSDSVGDCQANLLAITANADQSKLAAFGNSFCDSIMVNNSRQNFWLVELDSLGCDGSHWTCQADSDTTIGINAMQIGSQVKIWPNPVADQIHVSIGDKDPEGTRYILMNGFGQKWSFTGISDRSDKVTTLRLPASVASGSYWLCSYRSKDLIWTQKIIIYR